MPTWPGDGRLGACPLLTMPMDLGNAGWEAPGPPLAGTVKGSRGDCCGCRDTVGK